MGSQVLQIMFVKFCSSAENSIDFIWSILVFKNPEHEYWLTDNVRDNNPKQHHHHNRQNECVALKGRYWPPHGRKCSMFFIHVCTNWPVDVCLGISGGCPRLTPYAARNMTKQLELCKIELSANFNITKHFI